LRAATFIKGFYDADGDSYKIKGLNTVSLPSAVMYLLAFLKSMNATRKSEKEREDR